MFSNISKRILEFWVLSCSKLIKEGVNHFICISSSHKNRYIGNFMWQLNFRRTRSSGRKNRRPLLSDKASSGWLKAIWKVKKVEITQEEASSFAEQLKVDFQTPILENSDILWQYQSLIMSLNFPSFLRIHKSCFLQRRFYVMFRLSGSKTNFFLAFFFAN